MTKNMISVINLNYKRAEQWILREVSLEIGRGKCVGLWGANGVGKTSLLHILGGIERIQDNSSVTLRENSKVGFVSQNPIDVLMPWKTVHENLCLHLGPNKQLIEDQLNRFKITKENWNKYPLELSGGYQQRLALACMLIPSNSVLLLDEPFSMQDSEICKDLIKIISDFVIESNKCIILISHDALKIIECCHMVIMMQDNYNGSRPSISHCFHIDLHQSQRNTNSEELYNIYLKKLINNEIKKENN